MNRLLYIIASVLVLTGCSEPRTLGAGSSPTVAIDHASGTVYCAWFRPGKAGDASVIVSSLENGASTTTLVSRGGALVNAHAQAPPQVAVGPEGTVYVAWTTRIEVPGRRFAASNLLLSRSDDGGRTFSEPVFVNDDHAEEPAGHTFHNLAVGPDGTVYVSWLDSRGEEGEAAAGAHDMHHQMASNSTVRLARSVDGGRTFESVVVAEDVCPCCRTAIYVDGQGSVYLAWRQIYGEMTRDIALARSDDGGRSFSSPVRVHTDEWVINGCPHSGPAITVDADETVHVAWYTAAEGKEGLYYAASTDGGRTFGEAHSVASHVPVSKASLAASEHETWLAWERPQEGRIFVDSDPSVLDPAVSHAGSDPTVAAGAGKRAIAWVEDGHIHLDVSESE